MVAKLWQHVINEVAQLSESEQEAIAKLVLEQIAEHREEKDIEIGPRLRAMLEEARRAYREGRTEELDPDNL